MANDDEVIKISRGADIMIEDNINDSQSFILDDN